eukprot:CAMPEP_0119086162 /NCGR_PEP_ID=MMETSP1178-20130426/136692_1 /TAXON_ID=33656 /ORGANISM="unid sp, Strain CCMP2000" /LENGTH=54 /DNA_ID=CAMNT_0007069271 /DNA_START=120 /DNA_END=281 /DNA_ORIENTATION=-
MLVSGGGSGGGKELCHDFTRGMCTRGSSCRFSHGADDDRDLSGGGGGGIQQCQE